MEHVIFIFFLKKKIKLPIFMKKRKSVFHCLLKWIFLVWVKFSVLCCIVVQSWLIKKNQYYTIIMEYFIVWVVVCVIPACCFFLDECLNEETSGGIFGKKKKWMNRLFLFFHQHTSCLLRLRCQLDRQDCGSFYCSCLSQFLELIHQDCSGLLRN